MKQNIVVPVVPSLELSGGIVSFMRYWAWLVLFGSFMLSGPSVRAEDLMQVYKLAQERDPTFQSSRYVYLASPERLRQAYSGLLPTLSIEGEYIETRQDIVSSDNTVFATGSTDFPTSTYTVSLVQPIFQYSSIVRLRQAKAEVKRSDMEFEVAKQDLVLRVSEVYLAALAAQDGLAFAQAEEAAVQIHFELARARHNAGLAPITDLLDAKARLGTVKARKIEAQNMLDDALQALREVTGESIVFLARLKEELPLVNPDPADVDRWIEEALKQNLALEVQRHAAEVARQEVARQKSGHYPSLDLVVRHNWRETEGTLFGGGSEVETQEGLLRLNVPIYEGGLVSSRTREAVKLYEAALQDLEKQTRAVKRQTRAGYLGVESAISRAESLQQSVESQTLTLEGKREGFKSGLYTSLAVLDAERDLYLAKQDYAQARYDYILNSLRLQQAAGTLKEEDIAMVNQWLH